MVSIISAPRMTRWLLPFLTLAATFGIAYAVDRLTGKNCKRTALGIFIGLLLIPSLSTSMKWVSLLRANTFLETKQWLSDNLHGKEVVYSFEHRFDAPLSYEAARYHKEVNKQNESAKINYIVTKKDVFDGTGMNLFYDFYNYRYEELGGSNTKYILIAYWKKEKGDTIRAGVEKSGSLKYEDFTGPPIVAATSKSFKISASSGENIRIIPILLGKTTRGELKAFACDDDSMKIIQA